MFSSLPPNASRRARRLYRRLLISYIGVTTVIMSLSSLSLYAVVSSSLHRQHRNELKILAELAAPSLSVAKSRSEFFDPTKKDTHWHDLERRSQSIEWFDGSGNLLVREGKIFSELPLPPIDNDAGDLKVVHDREEGLYVATLAVFEAQNLVGIVRASESLRDVRVPLIRLRWGLLGVTCLSAFFAGVAGLWLSRLGLKPFTQSYQRLRQFTADASHEMRSPLAVIRAGLDVLLEKADALPPSTQKTLGNIDEATQQLRQLTGALLELARTDNASSEFARDPIPLNELLEDLVGAFEVIAADAGIELRSQKIVPVTIQGDNAALVRLFSNLLQNGIQYTAAGGKVLVSLVKDGNQAIVTVADTGIGLTPEDTSRVFERFWRADHARSRRTGGLGLGLAIAQDIARNHGGEIRVRSAINQGSTFEVLFPI
ncbi:MAG: HAMP domain-containing sensor histidine kinase [Cyanobacteria bacterium P01_H01_bin.15]